MRLSAVMALCKSCNHARAYHRGPGTLITEPQPEPWLCAYPAHQDGSACTCQGFVEPDAVPEKPPVSWLATALTQAKTSVLPALVAGMAAVIDQNATVLLALIEAALLTVDEPITEVRLRDVLRPLVERYAQALGIEWEVAADAIVGTLEWSAPVGRHVLDAWNGG